MLNNIFDCHVHTTRSACGENITDEWLSARAQENCCAFAVTDHTMHLYYEREIAWALLREDSVQLFEERLDSGRDNTRRYIYDIRSCGHDNMLVGVELDVLHDGQYMFPADLRDELDVLVGGVHFLPSNKAKLGQEKVEAEFRQQTQWLLEYGLDVLAHPFRIMLGNGYEVSDELMHWMIEMAGKHGAAVEINSHKTFLDYDVAMAKLAVAAGQRLAIGTDAHNTREFGDYSYHAEVLQKAGLKASQLQEILFRPDN